MRAHRRAFELVCLSFLIFSHVLDLLSDMVAYRLSHAGARPCALWRARCPPPHDAREQRSWTCSLVPGAGPWCLHAAARPATGAPVRALQRTTRYLRARTASHIHPSSSTFSFQPTTTAIDVEPTHTLCLNLNQVSIPYRHCTSAHAMLISLLTSASLVCISLRGSSSR